MRRIVLWLGLGVAAILFLAAAVFFTRPYTFKGSVMQPPFASPDFTLKDAQEKPFQLSAQRGKVVLLFFGYTHCTDACPATLSTFKLVNSRLEGSANNVEYVFITVDPQRDTPQVSSAYAASFDNVFIGLSGSETELAPVWKAYGVYRSVPENPTGDNYKVEHSTMVYVIDRLGNLRLTYSLGAPADDIVQDLKYLLR